ncbi:MAG: twin-arginine translocation signal domain-containing protein [Chloroflexi bacterium]|nr:twin-arginine translocation signal domain-containing protein [Chloroflexota bacterium]
MSSTEEEGKPSGITRRRFLKATGALALGAGALQITSSLRLEPALASRTLIPLTQETNPLAAYANRAWETVYRDQYAYDSSFTWICSPNDTHACRLRSFVKDGVVLRTEQNYDSGNVSDLYGNKATAAWNPRGCSKGFTMHRRVYGPYRLKYPTIRKGWKQWADDGFPSLSDNAALRDTYKFNSRGTDTFVRVTWDEAFSYIARAMRAVAGTYSGSRGQSRLRNDGYQPEMVEEMQGAGTRTMKLRGGMGLTGVIGKYGLYRMSNLLAVLDAHVRGVSPGQALGGRNWSNYTWHGDQAPGQPFVHGLQASDCDFNDLRYSKLHIQVGKNLVENKMPESHFFVEIMERGAKIVVISPEYSPPTTKADYWISARPGISDTAIFLCVSKIIMENRWYDEAFVKQFTDLPLLVRTDTLKRLQAGDVFPDYKLGLRPDGPSFEVQHLKQDQYERLGDYVVRDRGTLKPVTRDHVGARMMQAGIDPELEWQGTVRLRDGTSVQVMTLWELYKIHLKDYDLGTVAEITGSPRDLIERLAKDIATIKPVAIHVGEGVNHYFHATLHNRATFLPLMLTGNVGKPGAGCFPWAGNYKAALFQSAPWSGPGFKGYIAEDPFDPELNPAASGAAVRVRAYTKDEEPAYWDHGDQALIVDTPRYGRRNFTGKTHMPTPTKFLWFTNVNLINNAKWAYGVVKNVNPKIDVIINQDIEMTSSGEYADINLPANSWLEFQTLEVTASCSNPFLQIWGGGGLKPLYDTKDDVAILAGVAQELARQLNDRRFADYWRFAIEGKPEVYIQRLLDGSTTTSGYKVSDIMAGRYGVPGAALMLFRTYPRQPFYEQIAENQPFYTDTGRLNAYTDIPEAITAGENFIVHREGPEATPYLPNVIISTNPYVRPDNFGVTPEMLQRAVLDADLRTIANNKMSWAEAKRTVNPLWRQGFSFYALTPKGRHRVHSQWSAEDWHQAWESNFSDQFRTDKRLPGVTEHQLHIHPQAAKDLGIQDGDYVYVDANPADRPYLNADPKDPFYKVARLMLRVRFNPAYPYQVVMMKHSPFMATEKSVLAHETRADGRALSHDTGYQANLRYGSHQSITRDWSMPMHQTDTLFHKKKVEMAFMFGGEADNHAVNTVPKETLVRITKAEPGGIGGVGVWEPGRSGVTPGNENATMQRYLQGDITRVT